MSEQSRLAAADIALRQAYGSPELPEASNRWQVLLRVLFAGSTSAPISHALTEVLQAPQLLDPMNVSSSTTGQLVELLAPVPRGPQKASLIRAIAEWWLSQFGNDCEPDWSSNWAACRDSLRRIRGLGPATVDELLLFVGQAPVFPLDRGTIRVAVRHGWLDLPLEEDESQDFFVRGLRESQIEPRGFSMLLARVAEAHCGREPKCHECPLQPMLPANGPLNPESC